MAHDHAHPSPGAQIRDILPEGSHYAHEHHGHVIVPMRILLGVLIALLFFTVLTVFAAKAEVWFAGTFNVVIPQWMNVVIALSIGVVKSILVFAYFMQLRYDNPLNTMVVIFTVFVFFFFIGFTMIDLGNRNIMYDYRATHRMTGGTGLSIKEVSTNNKSIAEFAREQSAARVERWVKVQSSQRPPREELASAAASAVAGLSSAARAKGDQIDSDAKAAIDDSVRLINDALAPFSRDGATDHDIRNLQRVIYKESGKLNREAAAIATEVGDFEKSMKDAVENYLLRTRELEHRDVKFALSHYKDLKAANAEIPEWLKAFIAWHEQHGHDDGYAHAKPEPWNKEQGQNNPEQSRPRSGITLPELLPADKKNAHGSGHADNTPH